MPFLQNEPLVNQYYFQRGLQKYVLKKMRFLLTIVAPIYSPPQKTLDVRPHYKNRNATFSNPLPPQIEPVYG